MGRYRALTDEQVSYIKASDLSTKELAATFNVSYVTILKVRKGQGAYAEQAQGTLVFNPIGEVIGYRGV